MLDTSNIISAIAVMIRAGTTERQLLAVVARRFPDLSPARLSEFLQLIGVAAMALIRDEILKYWDAAVARVAASWNALERTESQSVALSD